jgi:hypothetical protein
MLKPTNSIQLAAFLFVDSRWCEPHDAVQCRARGSTFEFLFEFQTEFFSNFFSNFKLFENQTVRLSRVHCITFLVAVLIWELKGSTSLVRMSVVGRYPEPVQYTSHPHNLFP